MSGHCVRVHKCTGRWATRANGSLRAKQGFTGAPGHAGFPFFFLEFLNICKCFRLKKLPSTIKRSQMHQRPGSAGEMQKKKTTTFGCSNRGRKYHLFSTETTGTNLPRKRSEMGQEHRLIAVHFFRPETFGWPSIPQKCALTRLVSRRTPRVQCQSASAGGSVEHGHPAGGNEWRSASFRPGSGRPTVCAVDCDHCAGWFGEKG